MTVHRSIVHSYQKVEMIQMFSSVMNKHMWYSHTAEYYLVIKSNDLLIHAAKWLNLKNIMLRAGSQMGKITDYRILLL